MVKLDNNNNNKQMTKELKDRYRHILMGIILHFALVICFIDYLSRHN